MRGNAFRVGVVAVSMVVALFAGSAASPAEERQSYIVVLHAGTANVPAVAADLARAHGGQAGFIYEHAIQGFSVAVSPQGAAALARHPQVAYVETDDVRSIQAQTVPTGVRRIFAEGDGKGDIDSIDDYRVDVDVAVIDTGVDFQHPDLDVVGGVNCSGGSPFRGSCGSGGDDDHYHGTHVAGTVAAIDDGAGVVGVAPGARIWSVKVLNSNGSGYTSWIVAGIDWVAANAATIEVANMSLGGSGFNQAEYDAIEGAVNRGIAFAVAAGNSDADANNYSPAAFDNVLTVSALADFDGVAGGNGSSTCRSDWDDTLADFSNWGSAVQVTAPGVCILSTYPIERGEYGTISGTSMASPHAAGALALLASSTSPSDAADVYHLYDQVISAGNLDWTDDSGDGIKEPLVDVSDTTLFSPTLVAGSGGSGGETNSTPTASFTHACTDLSCSFDGAGSTDSDGSISSYLWDFGDGTTGSGQTVNHTYAAGGTYAVVLTVTDDDGAVDSSTQTVTVSSADSGDEVVLSGSSVNNGGTWTAIATVTAPVGTYTGTWSDGKSGSCSVSPEGGSCDIANSGIHKKVPSVSFTLASGESVTINKP